MVEKKFQANTTTTAVSSDQTSQNRRGLPDSCVTISPPAPLDTAPRQIESAGGSAATLTILAVAIRIVANPLSNVFQKQLAQRSAEPLFTIVVTHGLLTALALPLLAGFPLGALSAAFWWNSAAAAALAVAGYLFLWYALRSTDLSVLGPINAYKAVLGLALAVVLLGEVPTVFGFLGVTLIVAGSYFVVDRVPGQAQAVRFANSPASPACSCDSPPSSARRRNRSSSSAR